MEKLKAGGIIQTINLAQIGIMCIPDRPGIASAIFGILYEKSVNVQFIVQAVDLNNKSLMTLCVSKEDIDIALSAIESVKAEIQAEKIICRQNIAIVSVFGPHFRDHPGIAGAAFSALASCGINILAISTSVSSISCVVDGNCLSEAVDSLREVFNVPLSAIFTASRGLSIRARTDNEES